MKYKLYGDGIHDDTKALQELIDSGKCEVSLPAPEACYLISKPLELPSNFSLVLPRYAHIKLKAGSNCVMLKNKTVDDYAKRVNEPFWYHVNDYSPDFPCENIEVRGGIWDFNNKEQEPSPLATGDLSIKGYSGFGMLFYNVKGLILSSLTFKDPANFAIVFDTISYFTVENIYFDFNDGNPDCGNMDGVHLCGNCHFGTIQNLKGATYDDLVALNSDEGSFGEISNVEIRGIYAEDCHSAVRLLAANSKVSNIHISDIYGTYYQYCVGVTRFFETNSFGQYDSVTIENIFASKAQRYRKGHRVSPEGIVWGPFCPKKYADAPIRDEVDPFPIIFVDSFLKIKALKISNIHRREMNVPVVTIGVEENTEIEQLILENITTENHTDSSEMPLLTINGTVKNLRASELYENGKKVTLS